MARKRVESFLIWVVFLGFRAVLAGPVQPEMPVSSDLNTGQGGLRVPSPDPDLRLSGPAMPTPGCGPESAMNETLQNNPLKICDYAGPAPLQGEPSGGNARALSFPVELVAGILITLGVVALAATMWQALMLSREER
ncbi:MAG: hypothetical protein LC126_23755 [Bryobacterales bacterium]|nr:hypothetical protein [Bryobacterales bacterium]